MTGTAKNTPNPLEHLPGQKRVVINNVHPELDCGAYAIKRCCGEKVQVRADIFADGHDELSVWLHYRHESESNWNNVACEAMGNDLWQAEFKVHEIGEYFYELSAWIDEFTTWQHNLKKKLNSQQALPLDFLTGAELMVQASAQAKTADKKKLLSFASQLTTQPNPASAGEIAVNAELTALMQRYALPSFVTRYEHPLKVTVDRPLANFSAWYELFPRSCSNTPFEYGTFNDLIERLAYIKNLGFDVIYLPPIHPIGHSKRKGKNNNVTATATEPGSPWAIGSEEGGHMEIHPQLGGIENFRKLIKALNDNGLELALDFALQCSPDHPYLKNHEDWFKKRPDGSLQYAENPPKKYEDIYPLNFDSTSWPELWVELRKILLFWIAEGVKIFRVDNPHTKPFVFWQWLIREIKTIHPDILFLSEAFTRPKVMYHLAKLGFSQSYTYFTWRNTKEELIAYFTELTSGPVAEFFRPNLWPNTPDILHESLQKGGRPAFITRFILAATLGTNYGIYGPAFELCVNQPTKIGSEEYLDSEKYEIKTWDLNDPKSIKDIISRVNKIRREHPALQNMQSLKFHAVDNPSLICYSKYSEVSGDMILVVINLDYQYKQSGWVEMPKILQTTDTFHVSDLLTGESYIWDKYRNYVELDPKGIPAHILLISNCSLRRPAACPRDPEKSY